MFKNAFAEVIESSLEYFLAQSWVWDDFPNFSSIVSVSNEDYTILGTVVNINTGSMDPIRYPFPYQKTEEELRSEHPQIFEFLKTTFKVQILGYMNKQGLFYIVPPKPSKIHAFVSRCNKDIVTKFLSNPDFMHLLFSFQNNIGNLDELLLGILKQFEDLNLLSKERLHEFSKTYSLLTGNDYRRLKLFLQRAENSFKMQKIL